MAMPQWLEPMAATLTQERFGGGDWLFERKFDGIRLLAYKSGDEVGLFSRNRLPQAPARGGRRGRTPSRERGHPRRRGHVGRPQRLSRIRHPVAERAGGDVAADRRTPRAAGDAAVHTAPDTRRARRRRAPVGTRRPRGMGRRHRQAARFSIRAPAIEALAQDEVRGIAGARRRRFYRSPRGARRPWCPARRILRGRRLRLRRETRHRLRHQDCCSTCGRASMRSNSPDLRLRKPRGCPGCAPIGYARKSSCRSASSSGRSTANCGIRGCLACASTKTPAGSCARTRSSLNTEARSHGEDEIRRPSGAVSG